MKFVGAGVFGKDSAGNIDTFLIGGLADQVGQVAFIFIADVFERFGVRIVDIF